MTQKHEIKADTRVLEWHRGTMGSARQSAAVSTTCACQRIRLAQDMPLIKADAVQIQQVIVNLVRNAIEAMAPTKERPALLVICSRCDEDNVLVDVRDHGPGLADLE